jgi:mannonate dehydratase
MSTRADFDAVFDAVPSLANGMTFCVGSFGARPDNMLPDMVSHFGPRIHFAHLRNVRRETETVPCSFFEDEHLAGSSDMVAVVRTLLAEETRRSELGNETPIFMRPDHGHALLTDIGSNANPGYTAIGRLKGLAELRGVMAAVRHGA